MRSLTAIHEESVPQVKGEHPILLLAEPYEIENKMLTPSCPVRIAYLSSDDAIALGMQLLALGHREKGKDKKAA